MTIPVRHEMRLFLSVLIDMRTSILIMEYESDVLMTISIYQYFLNDETVTIVEKVNVPIGMNDLNVQLDNT